MVGGAPRLFPETPVYNPQHPLVGPATQQGAVLPALRTYTDFRPHSGRRARNYAAMPREIADAVADAAYPWRATVDGRPGLLLDGVNDFLRFPLFAGGLGSDVKRMTAWARFIPVTLPANGVYSSPFCQWNDNGSGEDPSSVRQSFAIFLANNAAGRAARTLEFLVLGAAETTYYGAQLTYAAADAGKVWTVVGVADGANVRVYLLIGNNIQIGTTSTATASSYSENINGSTVFGGFACCGKMDGQFLNCYMLGVGLWNNVALTLPQILSLHTDPWGIIAGNDVGDDIGKAGAVVAANRRRRALVGA